MKLVIVESPAKAKTIGKYLGADYKVDASKGHIWDLPENSMGIDFNNNYQPQLAPRKPEQKQTIEDRDKTIADLQAKLAKQPAEPTKQVVEDSKPGDNVPKNDVELFVDAYNSAKALYNEV